MPTTKATANKGKFKKNESATETDDDFDIQPGRKKTFDFSNGNLSFVLTISQIIALCIFVGGIIWFVAAEWHFAVKSTNLKDELDKKFILLIDEHEKKDELKKIDLEKEMGKSNEEINNLKECLKGGGWVKCF